jgi:hypothetical protein
VIALAWAGCAPEPSEPLPPGPLVDVAAWVPGGDPDPFADHRPADAVCDGGTKLETGTLEVDTDVCTWLWVTQPALAAVRAGDALEFVFWHNYLDAPEPAQGHLAVTIDGELVFEAFVDIPHEPAAHTETFDAPFDARSGAEVGLHLHNHGANTWNVLRLDRVDP